MSPLVSRPRKTYRGDALRAITMPLDGLGTGSITLAATVHPAKEK
jgi:hypothetical protein